MNIGMLNLFNVTDKLQTNQQPSSNKANNSFASLLGSIFNAENRNLNEGKANINISLEQLKQLLLFLQQEEMELVDENSLLINEAMIVQTDEELVATILQHLKISSEEFAHNISNLFTIIRDNFSTNEIISNENKTFDESLNMIDKNHNLIDQLINVLNNFTHFYSDQVPQIVNDDFINVAKVAKLYQLLSSFQDSYDHNSNQLADKLKVALQKLSDQLKTALQTDKQASRHNYLQKTFTTLLNNEVQQADQKLGQVDTTKVDMTKAPSNINGQMAHFHQMPTVEQLTLMLETNGRQVSPEQLMKQFNAILSKSQFLKEGGTSRLFIRLYPEHLGALRIELVQKSQMMVARILTTTAMAREMLDSQLNNLKQAFVNQNIQVERIEITQQLTHHERFLQQENQDNEHKNNDQEENRHNDNEKEDSFSTTFEDALLNVEV